MSARHVFGLQGSPSVSSGPLGKPAASAGHWAMGGLPRALEKIHGEEAPGPLCPPRPVQDKESMRQVMRAVDKANGYSFGDQEHRSLEALMSAAVGADFHFTSYPSPPAPRCAESEFLVAGAGGAAGGRLVLVDGSGKGSAQTLADGCPHQSHHTVL